MESRAAAGSLLPSRTASWSSSSPATGSISSTGAGRRRGAPGVLLIHGLSDTAWSWTPVARRLRAVRHVVAMDLRGPRPVRRPDRGLRPADIRRRRDRGGRRLGPARRRPAIAGRPRRARVRGDRRCLGRRRDGRPLRRAGAGRWRLGVARGGQRDGRRRVPAGPRRAARGDALDGGVPGRPRRRSTRRPGMPTRTAPRAPRVVETHAGKVVPATRPHAAEASVRAMFALRPARDAGRGTAPISPSPPPMTRTARGQGTGGGLGRAGRGGPDAGSGRRHSATTATT